jgi:hypothetical protein
MEFTLLGTLKEWSYHDVTEEHRLLVETLDLISTSNKHKQSMRFESRHFQSVNSKNWFSSRLIAPLVPQLKTGQIAGMQFE